MVSFGFIARFAEKVNAGGVFYAPALCVPVLRKDGFILAQGCPESCARFFSCVSFTLHIYAFFAFGASVLFRKPFSGMLKCYVKGGFDDEFTLFSAFGDTFISRIFCF